MPPSVRPLFIGAAFVALLLPMLLRSETRAFLSGKPLRPEEPAEPVPAPNDAPVGGVPQGAPSVDGTAPRRQPSRPAGPPPTREPEAPPGPCVPDPSASPRRVELVIAVPFAKLFRKPATDWPHGNVVEFVRETPSADALVATAAAATADGACNLCAVTVLVPEPPELHTERRDHVSASHQAAQRQWRERMQQPVDEAVCGAPTRVVKFRRVFPASRVLAAWHRAILAVTGAVADAAAKLDPKAVIVYREVTVSPLVRSRPWITALASTAAAGNRVAGCPVFQTGEPVVHTMGLYPLRSAWNDGVVLGRSLAGYRPAFNMTPGAATPQTVFAVSPGCFAAAAVPVANASKVVTKAPRVPGAAHIMATAARAVLAAGAVRGLVFRTGSAVTVLEELIRDLPAIATEDTIKWVRRIQDTVGTANHHAFQSFPGMADFRQRTVRARHLTSWRREGRKRQPWSPDDLVDRQQPWFDAFCAPQKTLGDKLVELPEKPPCIRRVGDRTETCEDTTQDHIEALRDALADRATPVAELLPDLSEQPSRETISAAATAIRRILVKAKELAPTLKLGREFAGCGGPSAAPPAIVECREALGRALKSLGALEVSVRLLRNATAQGFRWMQRVHRLCNVEQRAAPWGRFLGELRAHTSDMVIVPDAPAEISATALEFDRLASSLRIAKLDSLVHDRTLDLGAGEDTDQVVLASESVARRMTAQPKLPLATAAHKSVADRYLSHGVRLEWAIPCCGCCGFSVEAAWILRGVSKLIDTVAPQAPDCHCRGTPQMHEQELWTVFAPPKSAAHFVQPAADHGALAAQQRVLVTVHHWDPINSFKTVDDYLEVSDRTAPSYTISRSMYEFPFVPKAWIAPLASKEKYDEVWVPTTLMRNVMARSGIPSEKLFVIPEPVDTELFAPDPARRIPLPQGIAARKWRSTWIGDAPQGDAPVTKFLSIFKTEPRKGYDALIRAYCTAFTAKDRVSLYIVTYWWNAFRPDSTHIYDAPSLRAAFLAIAREVAPSKPLPHIVLIVESVSDQDIVMLYESTDAFVLPTRGEGWGLPVIQAMAMAKPTITTRHSGMLDFTTNETVMYVDVDEQAPPLAVRKLYDTPDNALWGEPRHRQLVAQMQALVAMPEAERQALGRRARDDVVARFSIDRVGRIIAERIVEIERIVRSRDSK